jgi:NADPH:quinone reductase-like Zn-dependent oxidoreductase
VKAVVLHEHGGLDKLKYEDAIEPICSNDEVLIKVRACGINHLDIWVRQGLPGKKIIFPHILGCDIVGEVTSPSRNFSAGEKVMVYAGLSCGLCNFCKNNMENLCSKFIIIGGFGSAQGGYAEYTKVPERNLIKLPEWFTLEEAATLGVSYLTSWNMLEKSGVGEGSTLLVYGAGSGVGISTIQLAKTKGVKVITTVGDEGKAQKARAYSPDLIINRKNENIVSEVMKFTSNTGVDAVIDHVGAQTWETSLKCLKPAGRMIVCGTTTGGVASVDIRALYSKQASIMGALMGAKSQLIQMMEFMAARRIKPVIDSTFSLSETAKAQERMEKSEQFGKIVLKI